MQVRLRVRGDPAVRSGMPIGPPPPPLLKRPERLLGTPWTFAFVAAIAMSVWFVASKGSDPNERHRGILVFFAWLAVVPIAIPVRMARRGVLSPGRWLAMAGFGLTLSIPLVIIIWVIYDMGRYQTGPSMTAGMIQVTSLLLLICSVMSIPGCILASVVHRDGR